MTHKFNTRASAALRKEEISHPVNNKDLPPPKERIQCDAEGNYRRDRRVARLLRLDRKR